MWNGLQMMMPVATDLQITWWLFSQNTDLSI